MSNTKPNPDEKKDHSIPGFNWYPGHIAKAEKELKEKIKLADLIIEVRDARAPEATCHRELKSWITNKPIILILNKADMADPKHLAEFIKTIPKDYAQSVFAINTKAQKAIIGESFSALEAAIYKLATAKQLAMQAKGINNFPTKVIVLGYPNVGKSTLINHLSKAKKAKTENKPGVTRAQKWIEMKSKSGVMVKLLDTPGIIPPKLYSKEQATKLALCSCVSDKAYDNLLVANAAADLVFPYYAALIRNFYASKSKPNDLLFQESKTVVEDIASSRSIDIEIAARNFLNDLKSGAFGALSFECYSKKC